LRLCIFETGLTPEPCRDRFGMYPEMVEAWLGPELPEARFSYVSVVGGEDLPDVRAFDGYLITGSRHGVYENLPWMRKLRAFLLSARQSRVPVFGICFGHQIMAAAYGADVRKSAKGWAIGAQCYGYDADYRLTGKASLFFHQDQVETVPEGARVIGGNTFCPIGALAYDFPALSVQYHPEFGKDYIAELATLYGGGRIPRDAADAALESLATAEVDNTAVARNVAQFFRDNV
jgi:GMP synthase-like glutamine amidotransferase